MYAFVEKNMFKISLKISKINLILLNYLKKILRNFKLSKIKLKKNMKKISEIKKF